ncbi:TspO/MBR family protein [Pseudalkalibacillus salsuginis]|uniref:TspO/MBR family protein n=1 Tax=Pseudalkalibacillus salsuginis TaxID=2910972 RepID=UPI001F2D179C|nr:TspO/MBR family protein [Pseudalkalibacillus salsuginis]MCF6409318.1 tryptophan-rich sensory protein [Pseudalkalibacillus salsuginis]
MNKKAIVLYILSVLSYLLMIGVNAYRNIRPLNGQSTGEISARFGVLFTPAGYVFSLWSVIYTLLAVWLVYLLFPKSVNHNVFQKAGLWFVLSSLLNTIWVVLWYYGYFKWTIVVMIGLLVSLIILYFKIQHSSGRRLMDRLPFSVYLGWVSIATIINASIILDYNNWGLWGLSEMSWTSILIVAGAFIAIFFSFKNNDLIFPLVFIWTYIGIAVEHTDVPLVKNTAMLTAIMLAAFIIFRVFTRKR